MIINNLVFEGACDGNNGYTKINNNGVVISSGSDLVSGHVDILSNQPFGKIQVNEINAAFDDYLPNTNGYYYKKPLTLFESEEIGNTAINSSSPDTLENSNQSIMSNPTEITSSSTIFTASDSSNASPPIPFNYPSISTIPESFISSQNSENSILSQTSTNTEITGDTILNSPSPFISKDTFAGYNYQKPNTNNFELPTSSFLELPTSSPHHLPLSTLSPSLTSESSETSTNEYFDKTPTTAKVETTYFPSSPSSFSLATTQEISKEITKVPSPSTSPDTTITITEKISQETVSSSSIIPIVPDTTIKFTPPPLIRTSTQQAQSTSQTKSSSSSEVQNNVSNIRPTAQKENSQDNFEGYDYARPQNPMTYPPSLNKFI